MRSMVVTLVAALFSISAHAQTPAIGKTLYATICAACHLANPSQDPRSSLAANNPSRLSNAVASVGNMKFLTSVLSTQDRADIAAYIGSPSAVGVSAATDAERLFNWAEWKLQTLLLPRATSQTIGPYAVRYYATPDLYVGIADGRVLTYQPSQSNAAIADIGALSFWLGQAAADGF